MRAFSFIRRVFLLCWLNIKAAFSFACICSFRLNSSIEEDFKKELDKRRIPYFGRTLYMLGSIGTLEEIEKIRKNVYSYNYKSSKVKGA